MLKFLLMFFERVCEIDLFEILKSEWMHELTWFTIISHPAGQKNKHFDQNKLIFKANSSILFF